jgi:hypothetical protein
MATIVTVETSINITEGGNTIVDRTFNAEYEVDDKVEGSYWLDNTTQKVTICVKGTNLGTGGPGNTPILDPMVIGLSSIRGLALENDINVELRFDSQDDVIKVAEGNFSLAQCDLNIIEITRDDTRTGSVKFVIWGDR